MKKKLDYFILSFLGKDFFYVYQLLFRNDLVQYLHTDNNDDENKNRNIIVILKAANIHSYTAHIIHILIYLFRNLMEVQHQQ